MYWFFVFRVQKDYYRTKLIKFTFPYLSTIFSLYKTVLYNDRILKAIYQQYF